MSRNSYQAPPGTPPWERQSREGTKAWEAFQVYRDLGTDRSIRQAAEQLGKSAKTLQEWSTRHAWMDRVAAWELEQDRQARKAQLAAIRKMRQEHAALGFSMLSKAAKALKSIPENEIKASDISRMVEVGSKLERLARGDVGEVIEERDGGESLPTVTFYMPENHRDDN